MLEVEFGESRYDRQERISWWDQSRLAGSRVLVVGAGALGNEVVKNLVLAGVGSIVVVDFDTIELSNLARCVFFRESDEGLPKAQVLARRAMELNPNILVQALDADIRAFGAGLALRADVMVGALDNREARVYLNRLSWRVGRPWIDGAIEALSGTARVFSPPDSCYECTLSERDREVMAHRQSCRLLSRDDLVAGKVPTTATSSSIIGGLQAQEVLKLLHVDRGTRVLQGGIMFDGANNDVYNISYPTDDECMAHHTFEDWLTIDDPGLTARQLAAAAGFDEAVVELGDDHVIGWHCTVCDVRSPAGIVATSVRIGDSLCPTCGEPRMPDAIASVDVPGPWADHSLASIGARVDELYAVRQGFDYRYIWHRGAVPTLPESWTT